MRRKQPRLHIGSPLHTVMEYSMLVVGCILIALSFNLLLNPNLVILTAGIVFSPERAMYALVGLFVTSKTIDILQIGLFCSKVAFIVSRETEAVRKTIIDDLDRGLTLLSGTGGYSGQERAVLMVVVSQREVTRLKAIVKAVDPNAFIILNDASEVLGEGFKVQH